MAKFSINWTNLERLEEAIKASEGNVEATINDVLHNEAYPLFEDTIKLLMPLSNKTWKGKKPPAKKSKSLQKKVGNLRVGVTSAGSYGYLYFPDDGTNTQRHVGNQQFFLRGVEHNEDEVIERCVERLTANFNQRMK